ncbi:thiamine pyrophosphate-dependent enzyme [Jatrophihabitans sp.]|uniref:thiamine pyrophosphate-dependent enzyme n=1 Tax=Jatrophihabitans sp. TaxID=1932789 RepID=UPI0030C6A2EC|nr:transporter [Jatrophihabitans sp.]
MTTPKESAPAPHDAHVRAVLAEQPTGGPAPDARLLGLFDAMAGSRLLDIQARRMRERGQGFYTIGSAGHESNALVAEALRSTDPALLHYRSGAFFLARALQAGRPLTEALRAVLHGVVGSVADPASGGRHKVWGDASLSVIPQTSTIASQLPRAVGTAFAIARAQRLGLPTRWPRDAVVVASFGDASINHSTAAGALNTAGYCLRQGLPLPIVFVCEDNGLGISVPSPQGWVAEAAQRPGIHYVYAEGDEPDSVSAAAAEAVAIARERRRPALLHLRTVRYLAHAGSDVESAYRSPAEIAAELLHDPLLALAAELTGVDLAARYAEIADTVAALADELLDAATLTSAAAVMAPLVPADPAVISREALRRPDDERRGEVFSGRLPEDAGPLTLAQVINAALADALVTRPELLVFGEDVGRKGGVYGLTRGLQARFGQARVFDTLLDEQAILGLGLGFGVSGLLPVPEIQYLAYLHNAEDQLRGEAASLKFFSDGAFTNPMVVRVAGLAYQRGFGGHFHNDDAVGVLRDIPGIVVAVPSRPEDAAPMLRSCLAAATTSGQVSVFLEPIALYHERDLHEPGDRGWLGDYDPSADAPIGVGRTHGDGTDLTIITYGNGLRMSLRVVARLAERGVQSRVLDLRWIAPLPAEDILREAGASGRVLVVDETRRSGGVGEGVLSELVDGGFTGPMARVTSKDSYIPLGDAADHVLLSEADIEAAALTMLGLRPLQAAPLQTAPLQTAPLETAPLEPAPLEIAASVSVTELVSELVTEPIEFGAPTDVPIGDPDAVVDGAEPPEALLYDPEAEAEPPLPPPPGPPGAEPAETVPPEYVPTDAVGSFLARGPAWSVSETGGHTAEELHDEEAEDPSPDRPRRGFHFGRR